LLAVSSSQNKLPLISFVIYADIPVLKFVRDCSIIGLIDFT